MCRKKQQIFSLCILCNHRPYYLIIILMCLFVWGDISEGIYSNAERLNEFYKYGQLSDWEYLDSGISDYIIKEYIISDIMDYGINIKSDKMINDSFVLLYKRELYASIVKLKPKNFYQYFIKTYSFYQLENYDSTKYYLKILSNYNKENHIVLLITSAILINEEQYDKAEKLIQSMDNDYARFLKSICLINRKQQDSALVLLEQINTLNLREKQIILLMDIYIKNKQFSKALNLIDEFEKKYSQSEMYFNVLYQKGTIFYKQGFFNKSIDILKFIARSTKNSVLKGNSYYLIGKNYFMTGDYENMEKFLSYVKNPLIPSDYKKNAEFLDGKGMFFDKNYKKAIIKMEHFIKKYPDDFLTPYAYQILAQSYFYINDFEHSLYYIDKLKKPEFVVDKLIQMKYFIDYKRGIYRDSIYAYEEFLRNEKDNPLRNEAYQYIIENESNENTKMKYFMNYLNEYPRSELIIKYYESLIDFMVFYEHFENIFKTTEMIVNNLSEYSHEVIKKTIIKMFELEYYEQMIDYFSQFVANNNIRDNFIVYLISKALIKKKNKDTAEFLLSNYIKFEKEDTYSDSIIILLAELYRENENVKQIEQLFNNAIKNNKRELSAYLLLIKGKLFRDEKNYTESLNIFIRAAELFGDDRNNAAICLYEAAYSAHSIKDDEYAILLLNRAQYLAIDIDIMNKIKVLYEKINN